MLLQMSLPRWCWGTRSPQKNRKSHWCVRDRPFVIEDAINSITQEARANSSSRGFFTHTPFKVQVRAYVIASQCTVFFDCSIEYSNSWCRRKVVSLYKQAYTYVYMYMLCICTYLLRNIYMCIYIYICKYIHIINTNIIRHFVSHQAVDWVYSWISHCQTILLQVTSPFSGPWISDL